MTRVLGIRGATTAEDNTREAILEATEELLTQLVAANEFELDDVAAAFFTTTEDLNAEFPALAARRLGWGSVALLCGHEMVVPDARTGCIRALILVNTDKTRQELSDVYIRGAVNLKNRGIEEV